jgi:protein-S-isoprenylcysteine O-methyltransferase Ste14
MQTPTFRMLSAAAIVVTIVGVMGLMLTKALFSPAWAAIAVQVAALALMLWARATFGARSFHAMAEPTQGALVTSGPYRFLRHPIYTAICLFILPAAINAPSISTATFCVLVGGGAVARMLLEERLLRQQYPEYASYAAKTQRMIPFLF